MLGSNAGFARSVDTIPLISRTNKLMLNEYREHTKVNARLIVDMFRRNGGFQIYASVWISTLVLGAAFTLNPLHGLVMMALDIVIIGSIAYYVGRIHRGELQW